MGSAVSAVKFEGVLHEFSTMPDVLEDVTDIILNLKETLYIIPMEESDNIILNLKKTIIYTYGHFTLKNNILKIGNHPPRKIITRKLDISII